MGGSARTPTPQYISVGRGGKKLNPAWVAEQKQKEIIAAKQKAAADANRAEIAAAEKAIGGRPAWVNKYNAENKGKYIIFPTVSNGVLEYQRNDLAYFDPSGKFLRQSQTGSGGFFDMLGDALRSANPIGMVGDAAGDLIKTVGSGVESAFKSPFGGAALSFLLPGVGSAIAGSLLDAGIVTSEVAANVLGNAIANATASVAQGQPLDKALTNAIVNSVTNTGSVEVAKEVNKYITSKALTDAIVSAAGSAVKTAASGGTEQDIIRNMTGALAGSAASSAYQKASDDYTRSTGRVIGSAVAGAVTGGATGAITGAVGEFGSQAKGKVSGAIEDTLKGTADTAALPPSEVAALTPDTDAGAASGTPDLDRVEVSGKALPPDITSTNIIDTIARTTPATPPPPEVAAPPKLETVEVSGKALPKVPDITDTDVINAMTKTSYSEGTTPGFPTVTVTATKPKDTTDITKTDIIEEPAKLEDVTVTAKAEEPAAAAPEEKPEEKAPEEKPYKPNLFILGGKQPKAPTKPSTSVLGQALGTTTGLTASRGAGEIEDPSTGKKKRKVWNEETLRLKDALGV